jgi:hypothetical protein
MSSSSQDKRRTILSIDNGLADSGILSFIDLVMIDRLDLSFSKFFINQSLASFSSFHSKGICSHHSTLVDHGAVSEYLLHLPVFNL